MLRRTPMAAAFASTQVLKVQYELIKYTEDGRVRCPRYQQGPSHFEKPFYRKMHGGKWVALAMLWYTTAPYFDIRRTIPDNEKFLSGVHIARYGVLGDVFAQTFSLQRIAEYPDEDMAVVDPTCMEYLQVDPDGAGGTSGGIYHWLGLKGSFPKAVTDKLYGICDAKSQVYQDGEGSQKKTVIHVISPDFRVGNFTEREAALLLGKAYRNVFHEFVRTGKGTLRIPPLAQGVYAGDLVDQIFPLTQEAMLAGFEQLHPFDKKELLTKKIELCMFMEKDWDKFMRVWQYVSPASKANPKIPTSAIGPKGAELRSAAQA